MTAPAWVDAVTSLLVVVGGLVALIGSLGVLRLGSFFQRVHAPTLGATLGTWCIALATVLQVSFARGELFVHAALIAVFVALTAPVTTIFLMRAAIFRERLRGAKDVPAFEDSSGPPASSSER
ncbi:MAG TPA: monovalent cation/H(+) antiporter subunit G [Myxococcales bacterium]|nr:monovalent cation/H(+) antiporter subunit G [Myxococcales bacterium]